MWVDEEGSPLATAGGGGGGGGGLYQRDFAFWLILGISIVIFVVGIVFAVITQVSLLGRSMGGGGGGDEEILHTDNGNKPTRKRAYIMLGTSTAVLCSVSSPAADQSVQTSSG